MTIILFCKYDFQTEKSGQSRQSSLHIFLIILLNLIFFISTSGYSQNKKVQTIRGQILEQGTELPIAGVSVIIKDSNPVIGTTSDEKGFFKLENVPVGRASLEFSFVGYKNQSLNNILVNSAKEVVLEIHLEEQIYNIKEVSVTANGRKDKPLNEMAIVSARSFTIEETERYAGSMGDPARMAANFAGVSTSSDQQNYIIIRGNSPQGLLWRMEGVEIPNPNHFASFGSTGGAISILNNNVLSKSDFFTGAFPAEYGNALAGVFDLQMRNGNNEKHEYLAQVGLNGFELGAEGPFSKNSKDSYIANFRYSTMEVFHALGFDFGTGSAVPEYQDVNFKINIPTKHLGCFVIFGLGGMSYIEMLDSKSKDAGYGMSGNDLYFGSNMGIAGIHHSLFLSQKSRLITSFSSSIVASSTKLKQLALKLDEPDLVENLKDYKQTLSVKEITKINAKNTISYGIIIDEYTVNYLGKQYDTAYHAFFNYFDTHGNLFLAQSYFQGQYIFSDKFTLNAGLHAMYLFLNQSKSIEPRISLQYNLNETNKISFGYGMHSQMLFKGVYFSKVLTDTAHLIYTTPDKNLDFMRSQHFVLGYDMLLDEYHRIKIETYYQMHYNIPVSPEQPEFSFLNLGGDYGYNIYKDMYNTGTGQNYGIEFTFEKYLHKGFYYLFTASLFDAKYKGYDGVERNSRFANNYIVNYLMGYEFNISNSASFVFDIKTVYAGGIRYIPIDTVASALVHKEVYQWNESFNSKYNSYFRLNARIGFRLNGKKVNQEWAVDLQNLTNHKNVFMQTWNNQDNKLTTSYQMGFLPMVTYRVNF